MNANHPIRGAGTPEKPGFSEEAGLLPSALVARETCWQRLRALPRRLHGDERGVISLLTVFVALGFVMLLQMILNTARHVDDRMRLQNGADAATYSGGVVMARGMNTLAFSNHLLSEVFALTAYLRVAERSEVDEFTEPILAAWREAGAAMETAAQNAGVDKFARLGAAIQQKIPYEQNLVTAYAEVSQSHAAMSRGAFESILGSSTDVNGGAIPRFQRALVRTTPALAQLAANEIAGRYGEEWLDQHLDDSGEPRAMTAVMWRAHGTDAFALASNTEEDWRTRTLPAVDPSPFGPDRPDDDDPQDDDHYVRNARSARQNLAFGYLEDWTKFWMGPYFGFSNLDGYDAPGWDGGLGRNLPGLETGKMSDYIDLMRAATRAELSQLLEDEYRYTNLPHMYRDREPSPPRTTNELLDRDQTYVGVAYWNHIAELAPGIYQNPLEQDGHDALAFAQATIFVPRVRWKCCPWRSQRGFESDGVTPRWVYHTDDWPQAWDLFNQNWMARLQPATSGVLPAVLSARPPTDPNFRPLPLNDLTNEELNRVSFH